MNRRDFLLTSLAATLLPGARSAWADCISGGQPLNQPLLAWLMLPGGPDFRHILPPAFHSQVDTVGHQYWQHRYRSHGIGDNPLAWEQRWQQDFDHRASAHGVNFGIHHHAGWLRDRWDAGQVAIICNIEGSTSRDHELSLRIMDQGNLETTAEDTERSGWGGRLAQVAGGNCVSLTTVPRVFCYGMPPGGDINQVDKSNLISLRDSRKPGLFDWDRGGDLRSDSADRLARSLESWYANTRALDSIQSDSPFHRFMESERKLREFGAKVSAVTEQCPIPPELEALYTIDILPNQPNPLLNNIGFGRQLRNLYDAILVNQDLSMQVCSLEYGGWDSHQKQKQFMEGNILDIFGTGRGLDMLWRNLNSSDRQNLILVVGGEFGRQLKDNGGGGTDHGRGNIILVIGEQVQGGVYGDMFPEAELARYGDPSPDIEGLTAFDHVFGQVADKVATGSGSQVFPLRNSRPIEMPGLLNNLFVS